MIEREWKKNNEKRKRVYIVRDFYTGKRESSFFISLFIHFPSWTRRFLWVRLHWSPTPRINYLKWHAIVKRVVRRAGTGLVSLSNLALIAVTGSHKSSSSKRRWNLAFTWQILGRFLDPSPPTSTQSYDRSVEILNQSRLSNYLCLTTLLQLAPLARKPTSRRHSGNVELNRKSIT